VRLEGEAVWKQPIELPGTARNGEHRLTPPTFEVVVVRVR
jgi:hypothetical protein